MQTSIDMSQIPRTKLKLFIVLISTVLVLVTLKYLNFISFNRSPYVVPPLKREALHNFTQQGWDVIKRVDILQKIPEYMKITELGNRRTVPHPKNSYFEIRNKKTQYHIGDTIEVYVELRDVYNKAINKGGDVLRIWMTETSLNASVGGYVMDFGDGTYLGVVKALWVGSPKITIAIGCNKEHIGIYLNFLEKYGSFFHSFGVFKKENHTGKAETHCASIPNSKYFNGPICNFTADNYNMPYYCGKPLNYECKDWTIFRNDIESPPLDAGTLSFFRTSTYLNIRDVRVNIIQDAANHRQILSPAKSCSNFQAAETWNKTVPVGYLYNNNWISLQCSIDFPRTVQAYTKCLTKTQLIFFGDSTTRIFFLNLMKFLGMKPDAPEGIYMRDASWQSPIRASSPESGIIVEWLPHEHPFASAGMRDTLYSVSSRLSEIGSNRNVMILVHWFLHPARFLTPEVYRQHVKNAVVAIKSLLQRSPNAKILIKGPHSHTWRHPSVPYDFVAKAMEQVLYEEFKDIHNYVYYVDYWDITLGNENVMPHPTEDVNSIMVHNFLSFVCRS